MILGFVTFASTFYTAIQNIGNFANFEGQMRSSAMCAFTGMGMIFGGVVVMAAGGATKKFADDSVF